MPTSSLDQQLNVMYSKNNLQSSFSVESILSKKTLKRKCQTSKETFEKQYIQCTKLQKKNTTENIVANSNHGIAEINNNKFGHVKVVLENKVLWDMFKDVGTEMVITKSGR